MTTAVPGDGTDTGSAASGGPGGGDTGGQPARKGRWPWRRWRAILAVVLVVSAALFLSPASPFEQAQEHDRVPVPPGGIEPAPHTTEAPPPKPAPSIPGPFPTTPPPSTPGTAPNGPPQAPPAVAAPEAITGEGYGLEYSDDFNGGAPDPNVWATAPFGDSLPPTVNDGHMTIRTTEANDHSWGYVASTGPRSDGEPNYRNPRAWEQGYFEARLRYTDNPWTWPAFWLFGMAKTEAWPGEDCSELNAEWDIFDNGVQGGRGDRPASSWYMTGLHRNTTDHTADGYCRTPDELRDHGEEFPDVNLSDWHTWGAYWSRDHFCTYLDDVQIQCMEPYETIWQPMHLTFSIQYLSRCDGCPPRPPSLELQVDWVRVWQAP